MSRKKIVASELPEKEIEAQYQAYRLIAPRSREELALWVESFCNLHLPRQAVCECHDSPLDYLCHAFFEGKRFSGRPAGDAAAAHGFAGSEPEREPASPDGRPLNGPIANTMALTPQHPEPETRNPEPAAPLSADCLVIANRGGGKTQLGAVATLLDLLFKPGVQVRILGGSLEQSSKMYEYLKALVDRSFADQLAERPTQRRLVFANGSRVEVLAQSDRSVRGQRVQKLRCDEVELFSPEIWAAAQLTTRSVRLEGTGARGQGSDGAKGAEGAEATGNRQKATGWSHGTKRPNRGDSEPETRNPEPVAPNPEPRTPNPGEAVIRGAIEGLSTMHTPGGLMQQLAESAGGRELYRWCIWDVMETCPPQRDCAACPLWDGCQGRGKQASGFMKIDDLIAMRGRVSGHTWDQEMLCHAPKHADAVFPHFAVATHVRALRWDDQGRLMVPMETRNMKCETRNGGMAASSQIPGKFGSSASPDGRPLNGRNATTPVPEPETRNPRARETVRRKHSRHCPPRGSAAWTSALPGRLCACGSRWRRCRAGRRIRWCTWPRNWWPSGSGWIGTSRRCGCGRPRGRCRIRAWSTATSPAPRPTRRPA